MTGIIRSHQPCLEVLPPCPYWPHFYTTQCHPAIVSDYLHVGRYSIVVSKNACDAFQHLSDQVYMHSWTPVAPASSLSCICTSVRSKSRSVCRNLGVKLWALPHWPPFFRISFWIEHVVHLHLRSRSTSNRAQKQCEELGRWKPIIIHSAIKTYQPTRIKHLGTPDTRSTAFTIHFGECVCDWIWTTDCIDWIDCFTGYMADFVSSLRRALFVFCRVRLRPGL